MTQPEPTRVETARWWIVAFGTTILLSAFLLFQVQPLVSKAILPWFGGAPAVWTTCMLFFQSLLFGGYLYAHLMQSRLSPRHQGAIHLALVAVAAAMLPVLPGAEWKPAPQAEPTWQILVLLAATVGLPYFVLSATSPLVQAWFGGAYPGRSPYRLYALSNVGSLAALLSYPFVFEPAFDLAIQSSLWSGAFIVYAVLCAALLACVWQLAANRPAAAGAACAVQAAGPSWLDRLRWVALPACASLMLLAATNHICQDVAVAPFLWVAPLSLYLLSFIICFDHSRWYVRRLWAALAVVSLVLAAWCDFKRVYDGSYGPTALTTELQIYLSALFCACMVCHGELARLKPAPRYLTEFYLLLSAGGALGGAFTAIAAPKLFSTYLEWPIGVAATFVLSVGLLVLPKRKTGGDRDSAARAADDSRRRDRRPMRFSRSAGAAANTAKFENVLFRLGWAAFGLAALAGLFYAAIWQTGLSNPLYRRRNFFGVVSVIFNAEKNEFQLRHGRIQHGRQSADPEKRRLPSSYYGEQSGAGEAIRYYQKSGPIRAGIVGLGAGTLATYARPEDAFRFYEINPEMIRLACDFFSYLPDCRGKWEIIPGDARLALEAEPRQEYDVLVLDAFSGDAIPTHLLTREAFEIYRRHLKPDGAIAVHVSNNHLLLGPVVRRLADDCGMKTVRLCTHPDPETMVDMSQWIVVTNNEDFLDSHPPRPPSMPDDGMTVPVWTDQYSNLLQILAP